MKADKIFKILCNMAPLNLALDFDNSGFLLGNKKSDVKKAVVCLDVTGNVIEFAENHGANLIISHHPIIFNPVKSITNENNNRVYKCLSKGISVISMHTNMDSAENGVNDSLAKALCLKNITSVEDADGFSFRMGKLKEPMSAEGLAKYVKSKLGGVIRFVGDDKMISTVAVCGGSGGEYWQLAKEKKAGALITADVKHNIFIEAAEVGFALLDAGHFNTENVVVKNICEYLSNEISGVDFFEYDLKEIKTV